MEEGRGGGADLDLVGEQDGGDERGEVAQHAAGEAPDAAPEGEGEGGGGARSGLAGRSAPLRRGSVGGKTLDS